MYVYKMSVKVLSHPGHLKIEWLSSGKWTFSCDLEDVSTVKGVGESQVPAGTTWDSPTLFSKLKKPFRLKGERLQDHENNPSIFSITFTFLAA